VAAAVAAARLRDVGGSLAAAVEVAVAAVAAVEDNYRQRWPAT